MKKKLVVIVIIIIVALIAAGAGAFGYHYLASDNSVAEPEIVKEETVSISIRVQEAFPISEIMTYQVNYSEVVSDQQTSSFEIFDVKLLEWIDKKTLVIIRGELKFGFNGKDVSIEEDGNRLIITVPRVRVLASGISDEVDVYDQQGNYSITESIELTNQAKEQIAQSFEEDEQIVSAAQQNAEIIIRSIIKSIPGSEDYEFVFIVLD